MGIRADKFSGICDGQRHRRKGPEANQELFIFRKVGDDWKIARYSFSTTNPPRQ